MSGLKLITELSEAVKYQIDESSGAKKYYIEGTFAVAEQKNQNGRIYPYATLHGACSKFQKIIESNRAYGELGHPAGPGINLDKVSHMIKEMHDCGDGKRFVGKALVLDTPNGQIVQRLLDAGANLGVSTRGMGSLVAKEGYQEVQADFHLATVDIVADPSAPGAFVQGIMEGREWIWNNGVYEEAEVSKAKKMIESAGKNRAERERRAIKLFEAFINRR